MTDRWTFVRVRRAVVALVVVLFAAFGWSVPPVAAHTDFEGSVPADGATVEGPVSTVTIEFTNPAVESGEGFALLEPDGTVRRPDSVDATDGTTFIAVFDPPLGAGTHGFRWEVRAGDAHPIDGSFQFTVQESATPADPAGPTTAASATPEATTAAATAPTTTSPAVAGSAPSTTAPVDHSTMSMDEFMAAGGGTDPMAGRVARTISMGSTVFAVGVLAALLWVVRGRRDEIERLLVWVRLAGLGSIAGGLAALATLDEAHGAPLADTATSKPGVAALLTMAGGVLVFAGLSRGAGAIATRPLALSSAVAATDVPARGALGDQDTGAHGEGFRWTADRSATIGLVGIVAVLGAYWFDGHTVSRGPWVVHAVVNLVHVTAASVWVGGVFAMTLVAWMRSRRRTETGLAPMVVRFSTIAALSLIALAAAGVVMAWLVLESPGDLFSTDWGRVLLVKVAAVAVAAGVGGYNHFRLRPVLEARPDDPAVAAHLRISLAIESALMVAVIVVTAVLVAAST